MYERQIMYIKHVTCVSLVQRWTSVACQTAAAGGGAVYHYGTFGLFAGRKLVAFGRKHAYNSNGTG
jgi:hypothetical protein